MRTQVVLIDFENVQPDLLPVLNAEHIHVRIFIGPQQLKLSTDVVLAVQGLEGRAKFIQISKQGKEALDLHLAYYLGRLTYEFENAFFHIISKDQGFLSLAEHLNRMSQSVGLYSSLDHLKLSQVILEIPRDLEGRVLFACQWLKSRSKHRPATHKTLISSLEKSAFHKQINTKDAEQIITRLIELRLMSLNNSKVEYADAIND